jgi:hypothetical protein
MRTTSSIVHDDLGVQQYLSYALVVNQTTRKEMNHGSEEKSKEKESS